MTSARDGIGALKGSMKEHVELYKADEKDMGNSCENNTKDGA